MGDYVLMPWGEVWLTAREGIGDRLSAPGTACACSCLGSGVSRLVCVYIANVSEWRGVGGAVCLRVDA